MTGDKNKSALPTDFVDTYQGDVKRKISSDEWKLYIALIVAILCTLYMYL